MFTRIFIWILIIVLFANAQPKKSIEQKKTRYGFKVDRRPEISYQLFVHRTKDWKPVVFLAINIQNDKLQFEKKDDRYHSRFRVTFAVRDSKTTLVNKNSWVEDVYLSNFAETNSKVKMQYRLYRLPVFRDDWRGPKFGKFESFLEIQDMVSQVVDTFKQKFEIKKFSGDWASTDITFLRSVPDSGNLPLLGRDKILEFSRPSWAFLRLLNRRSDKLTFNVRIYRKTEEGKKLYFQKFLKVKGDSGIFDILFSMPYDSLEEGAYLLRFSCEKLQKEKKFQVIWFDKPTYLYKYDLAIRPMRLILDEKTFKKAKSLGRKELEAWFKAYWKKRDPSPGTVYNELLAEFFHRVQYANRKYSTRHKEGWETDQGKIYILYGKPIKIDDHRYATETRPYQVWIYSDSLQFMFVDKKGNGEFTLITEDK
ncbi:MAG: GWxTD domain-containing protein [Calditrichaeota bacterium]|nr:GWxTD domain-containing protein [Calditrichota bacterium]